MKTENKFPFIYIGHGKLDSTYIDKCEECYIWFEKSVENELKREIIKGCPAPLAHFFNFGGEFLHFGCSDDAYNLHIIESYCDERTRKKIKANDFSFLSGEDYSRIFNESLDKFAAALEHWMLHVNSIVPVAFFIGPNGSSDEDAWNRWSREKLKRKAKTRILSFLETRKDIFSENAININDNQEELLLSADGTILKDLSNAKTRYVFGFILRFIMKFPDNADADIEKSLQDDLKIIEALFETDEIVHYIETLTYSDSRIKTNSNILFNTIKEFTFDRQIEILQTLESYTQLAFYASNYNNSQYLVNQKNPLEILRKLLAHQKGNRKPALAGLLYFMANNIVKAGPGYRSDQDYTNARLAAQIIELSFEMAEVRAEAFINAAAFYYQVRDFQKMLDVSIKGNLNFNNNTTIIANIIYSAQNLGKKDIADKFVNMTADIPSKDVALLLNQTYNFIKNGEYQKARQMVLKFIEIGGVINPQIMNNILYTYIHGAEDKFKDPFLMMTMNYVSQPGMNDFKTNKEFICNATIVFNNIKRFNDSEKLLEIFVDNGGELSADILNQMMYTALELKDKSKVLSAVNMFVKSFQSQAQMISEHEYALHSAACCFGFLGDKINAMEYVRLAEWNGYNNFAEMKNDEYLQILRDDPEFIKMFN